MKLQQLYTVVTGAAGGLGRRFVYNLLQAGASVAAGDTNAAGLRSLKAEAEELPGRLHVGRLDVTDETSTGRFLVDAAAALGSLNSLIHSAGISRDGLLVQQDGGQIRKLTLTQWRKVVDVNLTGAFLMTRDLAAHMLEQDVGPGCFVHLSSVCRKGNPGQSNYAASKAGLDAATRTWALELAPHGIRVAAVAPGVTQTGFLEGMAPERLAEMTASIPVGRIGNPDEIWGAVRFVLENDFFNGRVLEIDGGAFIC